MHWTFPRFGLILASCALFMLPAMPARAQTLAFNPPASGSDPNGGLDSFSGSLGLLFSLTGSLTITGVGYWDDNQDGVPNGATIQVAIFDRNASGGAAIVNGTQIPFTGNVGTLMGNTVTDQLFSDNSNSNRPGQFRLVTLGSPVVLPAGNYAVVAWGYDGINEYLNGASAGGVVTVDSFGGLLTFDGSAFGSAGSYPTTTDFSYPQYTAATFSAIPEPAEAALALGGSAAAGAWIARRRKNAQG